MAELPDLIGNEIADLTAYFEKTGNVAAAWRAYSLAQTYVRPIPAVLQAEVDRFAACVSEAAGRAIQTEIDLYGETIIQKKDDPKNKPPPRTYPHHFRDQELYAAWRNGIDNPIGQLQTDWRDNRIFAAIQTLVDRGVRPGRAREMVKKSGRIDINLDAIEQIWKRLKTKKPKRPAVRRGNG